MNIIKLTILIGIITLCSPVRAQTIKANYVGKDSLHVMLVELGKSPFRFAFNNIKSKYITTALWVNTADENKLPIIVNDRVFNYVYLQKNVFQHMKSGAQIAVVIYVDKYKADSSKTVYVATRLKLDSSFKGTPKIPRQTTAH